MLVEINLLPEKEKKSRLYLTLLLTIILIFILSMAFILWQQSKYKQQLNNVSNELVITKQVITESQKNLTDLQESNSFAELQKTVNWAEQYPIEMLPILNHLISLLPERGFIQAFSYGEDSSLNLIVQFDTSREVAYYLNSLVGSEWLTEASLTALTTMPIVTELDEVENQLTNETFVPRYMASYELVLNKSLIKSELTSKDEGGSQ